MRRYGQWAGNERGAPEKPDRCIAELYGDYISRQCARPRGHGTGDLDGLLCKQHAKKQAEGRAVWVPEESPTVAPVTPKDPKET